jgi:transcription initiation factor TFIIF subunit beta
MARIPRNQLLDLLFEAFRAQAYWPLRALRERTQQPEQYLKEVLTEVASLHRAGEHAGTYELKPQFAADGTKSEADLYAKTEFTKAEDAMDEDEDDDDEDDMEEVG